MMTLVHTPDCQCTTCNPTIAPLQLLATKIIRSDGDIVFEANSIEFEKNLNSEHGGEWYVWYTEHRKKLDQHIPNRALIRSWNSSCMLGEMRHG